MLIHLISKDSSSRSCKKVHFPILPNPFKPTGIDIFKSDFEYCVDKVNAVEGDYTYAARSCAGASSGVKKCMKKIYATEGDWTYAARSCTGN